MGGLALLQQGDAVTRAVTLLLLAMSVASWVLILWKTWLLGRASRSVARSTAAFWQSASLDDAEQKIKVFDPLTLVLPLLFAIKNRATNTLAGSLAGAGERSAQLTRLLRGALHEVQGRLQWGQVLLATVGSTAPFVGLLGTVWGIYHALTAMAGAGQITIDQVAGPVGEALIMTAAGLAVAIPAVLAYNWYGRRISRIEAELEGFAFDLRELFAAQLPPQ